MVSDPDNDCRWQALIAVGNWIESGPDAVWEVVCEFGDSEDDDMRAGVGCVLLEHLLDHDFDLIWPRVKAFAGEASPRFRETVGWSLGFLAEGQKTEAIAWLGQASAD